MDKLKNRRHAHRPSARRLVQLYAALLYNANIKGFIKGELFTGGTKALCVPGLNCYSCPGAVGACPLGALQNALATSGHTAGWYIFGIILLFGITLGRTICGWLCPMGLIQELLHKIPTPKLKKSAFTRALSLLKYIILAVFVIALPLIYGLAHNMPLPAFCKYICPAGTLEGAIGLLSNEANGGLFAQLGLLFTRKFVILLTIGLSCIFCYRAFCRFLCPLGAIYGMFNRFALIGVKVDDSRCSCCGACVRRCEMDIRHVSDRECIACGKCMGACAQGAISIKCGSLTLKGADSNAKSDAGAADNSGSKHTRRIIMAVLIGILAFILVYCNFINNPMGNTAADESAPIAETVSATVGPLAEATAAPSEASTAVPTLSPAEIDVGYDVGQRLADFECTLLDGTEFRLSDARGHVVFINQWATYCTPCIAELPYFEQLKEEYPDIVVLAFHNWLEASPTAVDFVEQQGWTGWRIDFALDSDQTILKTINGDNVMPRTVVLDKDGVVIYNETRSVTFEMLVSLLESAEGQ